MSTPSNAMRPDRIGSKPMMLLRSVVLPTPFRPIRHTTLPAGTSSDTSHRIWLSPYATSRFWTLSIGIAAPAEIYLHHTLVLLDLLHRPLAQHLPLVEDGDRPGDVAHELHVVLDHEHRPLLGNRL